MTGLYGFQSLFSWNLPSEQKPSPNRIVLGEVSILVFLDLALRAGMIHSLEPRQISFNPCFLGSCSPRSKRSTHTETPNRVSILVFLDLALRESIDFGYPLLMLCFNPCFLGSCSPRKQKQIKESSQIEFQSLFSWILLSENR